MKRGWIIASIILVVIIVLAVIFFYNKSSPMEEQYDITKEQPITFIPNWLNVLEECQGHSRFLSQEEKFNAGYSSDCLETTDIDATNLNKFKALENVKGILVANNSKDYDYFKKCNILWEFDYQKLAATVRHTVLIVYNCENRFFIVTHSYPGSPVLTIYSINLNEETLNKLQSTVNETDLIRQWGENCSDFVYGSVWETVHGYSNCYHVFSESYYNNNTVICTYLRTEFDKAKCFGISAEKWENSKRCSSLSQNNKEICILNVLWKLDRINYVENIKGIDVCKDILNESIKSICLGYKSIINSNYSICTENNVLDNTCRVHFLVYNKDPLVAKKLCEDLFTDPKDLYSCYRYSQVVNLTELPEEEIVTENIPTPVNGEERPTNQSLFFQVLNINSNYPYVVTYSISYWDKNPYWNEGDSSVSEYLYHLVSSDRYVCKTKIRNTSEINDSCFLLDDSYKALPPPVSIGIWNYGI
jgi:hypothetical protein